MIFDTYHNVILRVVSQLHSISLLTLQQTHVSAVCINISRQDRWTPYAIGKCF
jgi:hypothetical protein